MLTLEEVQGLTGLEEDELIACLFCMEIIDASWASLNEEHSMEIPVSHEETETLYFNGVVNAISVFLEDHTLDACISKAEAWDAI